MTPISRLLPVAALAASLLTAPVARSTTYYWKPGATLGDYGTLSNWSTESLTGADAAALPGSGDRIELNADYALDLGGASYSLAGWGPDKTNTSAERTLFVTNGVLSFANLDAAPCAITIADATFTISGRLGGGNNGNGTDLHQYLTIKDGGLVSVYDLNPCRFVWIVEEGGTLTFNNKYFGAYGNAANATDPSQNGIWNNGTLNVTPTSNGSTSEFSLSGNKGANWRFTLAQQGGTMNLPCPINGTTTTSGRIVYLYVSFSGGTINVTGDTAVRNCTSATLSGSTTWNVHAGKTADLSTLTIASGTAVAKAGTGALVLPSVPDTFAVTNGTAALATTIPSSAALQTVAVMDGGTFTVDVSGASIATLGELAGTLVITKPGLTVSAVDANAALSGAVEVNLTAFATGGTVVTTPSAALRAKVLAAAQTAIADAGASLTASDDGAAIVLATAGALKVFESTTVMDLADAAGWRGGDIPASGEAALVSGAGVTGTLTAAGLAKGWSSISVQNGATLRLAVAPGALPLALDAGTTLAVADGVSVGVALASAASALVLEPGATLALADGDTFALSAAVTTEATSASLSTIHVPTGATLRVAGGYAFRNVNLVLDGGTLALADTAAVTFGGAAAGETNYFAMAATGATIGLADTSSGNSQGLRFACPAAGGTVKVVGDIVLKDSTLANWYKGFALGENNPTNEEFAVVLDNTSLTWYKGTLSLAGASSLVVSNGTLVTTSATNSNDDRFSVSGAGQLVIGEGGTVFYPVAGNGNTRVEFSGPASDRPAVVLAGGLFEPYKTSPTASARTILVATNSTWQVFEDTYWWDGIRNILFDGAAGTEIAAGATLTVRNRRYSNWEGNDNTGVWFADRPITGAGDLVLTNAYAGRPFAAMLRHGANTCTGTIAALGDNCALLLTNGCNWAGTLVANGNISLRSTTTVEHEVEGEGETTTETVEVDVPASVSFGGVRLDGDAALALRVWSDGSADHIAVGTGGFTGAGTILLAPVDGAVPGRSWKIGTIAASAAAPLPDAVFDGRRYAIGVQATAVEGVLELVAKRPGTVVLFR